MKKSKVQVETQTTFTFEQCEKSLAEVDILAEDANMFAPILLGETLRSIIKGKLDCSVLEIGIMSNWLGNPGDSVRRHIERTFKNVDAIWKDDKITFETSVGMPVEITIIPKKSEFFLHLDTLRYPYVILDHRNPVNDVLTPDGYFHLPNPKNKYLESVGLPLVDNFKTEALIAINLKSGELANAHQ